MPLPDWHPEKWQYYEHTRVKHILLDKYLRGWTRILGGFYEKICYFDCFAGRGEYKIDNKTEVGSPIIALRLAKEMEKNYNKFLMIFIEKDLQNFESLKRKLEEEGWDENKIEVYISNKSFSEEIGRLIETLEKAKANPYPSFFFIDPFGFSDVPSELIGKILSYKRTEIFFTFMVRDINRFLSSKKHEDALNKLYWNDDWKKALKEKNRELALVKLYDKQLKELGGARYTLLFRVCMDQIRRTAYYLIHASNHFKAFKLMKDIAYKQSGGRFGFFGPLENVAPLLSFSDCTDELKKYLLKRFSGEVQMMELMEKCYIETPYIQPHIWKTLKALIKDGKIKIEGLGPRGGYREDATVIFS